jgi:hypothetical protein
MEDSDKCKFKDLHFVEEDEGPALAARVMENRNMLQFLKFFDLSVDMREYVEKLKQVRTVTALQHQIMVPVFEQIFQKTTDALTCDNIALLPVENAVVYISNHRDIILDSGAMNMTLFKNGIRFGNAGIGDNLLMTAPVTLVFNIMKCFVVKRSLVGKEQVLFLRQLSEFIAYSVKTRGESIWLAQRSGRAKDGNDKTNPAVIKMMAMAGKKEPVEHLKSLNLIATAASYEWDPCDVFKVKELLAQSRGVPYIKSKNEDMVSIRTGICGRKGGLHIGFEPITPGELDQSKDMSDRERYSYLTDLMDRKILNCYRLWPTNYIAADLLNGGPSRFRDRYTKDQKEKFLTRMDKRLRFDETVLPTARRLFLEGYANPVFNKVGGGAH